MVTRKRSRHLGVLAEVVVLAAASALYIGQAFAAGGTTVYVSPSGSDGNTGLSPGQAVQTLPRAQAVARELNASMSGISRCSWPTGTTGCLGR